MKKCNLKLKVLSLVLFLTSLSQVLLSQDKNDQAFSIIAFGDMPYVLPQDYARFENVIKTINDQKPAFSVNVGDFKASSTPCSEEVFTKILNYYQQFDQPMIYTPGDNEWTDCTKKDAGAYDAEERLMLLRKMFFKDQNSFGKQKLTLSSQSKNPDFVNYVENNYWFYHSVAFATMNIVGSNNNFLPTSKNGNKEFFEREKANLAWMEETFKKAKENNAKAVVFVIQADMYLGNKDLKEASGFIQIKKKLAELSADFKKPVLLINGDSHDFIIEKPIVEDQKTKKCLENFTRLQVPGESNMHVTKIYINPNAPSVFMFEEIHVTGN